MTKSRAEQARDYLWTKIPAGMMREASYAAGRNHAYIQQYLMRGKPRWLPEPVREALVLWDPSIDPAMLKPPGPRRGRAKRRADLIRSNAPTETEVYHDAETRALLAAWRQIRHRDTRRAALDVITALAEDESTSPLRVVA